MGYKINNCKECNGYGVFVEMDGMNLIESTCLSCHGEPGEQFTEKDLDDFVGSAPGLTGEKTSVEYIDSVREEISSQLTTTPPTEPGWYWFKCPNEDWTIGEVKMGSWYGGSKKLIFENAGYMMLMSDPDSGQWQGPIPEPEEG